MGLNRKTKPGHAASPANPEGYGGETISGNYCFEMAPCKTCSEGELVALECECYTPLCSECCATADAVCNKFDGPCKTYDYTHFSIIFNAFVFCQVFNEFNARSIGNEWNVFAGLFRNPWFLSVVAVICAFQVMVIQSFGEFAKTSPLSLDQWGITIAMGVVALPLGVLMRALPPRTEAESQFAGYDISSLAAEKSA